MAVPLWRKTQRLERDVVGSHVSPTDGNGNAHEQTQTDTHFRSRANARYAGDHRVHVERYPPRAMDAGEHRSSHALLSEGLFGPLLSEEFRHVS